MAHQTILNTLAAFFLLVAAAVADEPYRPRNQAKARPSPVQLSARQANSMSQDSKNIEILLAIGDEYEIYSEREHEFVLPLQIQLLDAGRKSIESKIIFPKPKVIPTDKALGGDHHVYVGEVKLNATYSVTEKPASVRLFYHGYSIRGY